MKNKTTKKILKKSKITLDVESKLRKMANKNKTPNYHGADYIIGSGSCKQVFLNLTTPMVRGFYKTLNLTLSDIEKIWFESNLFSAKSICLYYFENQTDDYLVKHYKKIISMASLTDNWAHSDSISSLLARISEKNPFVLIHTYEKWSLHKNPWYRRHSMVGLFYYSNARKIQPPFQLAKKFITANLSHEHYYVQKAVGWTLREMYNVYPKETLVFINENIKNISSTAWVATSEKLPLKIKNKLLKARKKS